MKAAFLSFWIRLDPNWGQAFSGTHFERCFASYTPLGHCMELFTSTIRRYSNAHKIVDHWIPRIITSSRKIVQVLTLFFEIGVSYLLVVSNRDGSTNRAQVSPPTNLLPTLVLEIDPHGSEQRSETLYCSCCSIQTHCLACWSPLSTPLFPSPF